VTRTTTPDVHNEEDPEREREDVQGTPTRRRGKEREAGRPRDLDQV